MALLTAEGSVAPQSMDTNVKYRVSPDNLQTYFYVSYPKDLLAQLDSLASPVEHQRDLCVNGPLADYATTN